MLFKKKSWQTEGNNPDYRFSLANERTFLAWIRTALAFLAGAVAIDQLVDDFASPLVRCTVALFLSLSGALLAFMALYRWENNEKAMRNACPLAYTSMLYVVASIVLIVALTFSLIIIFW